MFSWRAEVGHVGSNGSAEGPLTQTVIHSAGRCAGFSRKAVCDALAVAIGTAHGIYKQTPHLDLDCLSRIAATCPLPLVLHGGSGLSDQAFRACVAGGISKINIFTQNNLAAARVAHAHYTPQTGAFEWMPLSLRPSSRRPCIACRSSAVTEKRERPKIHRGV